MTSQHQITRTTSNKLNRLAQYQAEVKLVRDLLDQGKGKSDIARILGKSITWVTRRLKDSGTV